MDVTESVHATRVSAYATVGTHLSLLSDRRLADAVSAAESLGSGIGGRSAEMRVAGTRVFVKRVPLTDIELQPAHVRSTANVFDLPLFYQYGVGSAGFGAWRELAAHIMTTGWVLKGEHAGFPLLYHWRVLPDSPHAASPTASGSGRCCGPLGRVMRPCAMRLEAIGRSSSSLVLFMEHVPRTLGAWLAEARDAAPGGHSPCLWVEDAVVRGTEFMSARGLVHFDAHFSNLLTDGKQVYFADFGLALSRGFDLSA